MAETARHPESRYGNRPTMKDVAARAGVGLKTVSRVTPASLFTTRETVLRPTPARAATSFMVGRLP